MLSNEDREKEKEKRTLYAKELLCIAQALFLTNSFLECHRHICEEKNHCGNRVQLNKIDRIVLGAIEAEEEYRTHLRDNEASQLSPAEGVRAANVSHHSKVGFLTGKSDSITEEREIADVEAANSGSFIARNYPWMSPVMLHRSDAMLQDANELVKISSYGQCSLRMMQHYQQSSKPKATAVLGMVAEEDLHSEALIMNDKSVITGVNRENDHCPACRTSLRTQKFLKTRYGKFCSFACYQRTAATYHQTIHMRIKQDNVHLQSLLRDRVEASDDTASFASLLFRVLECAVKNRDQHPLNLPLFARLSPGAERYHADLFSLRSDICRPLQMLIELKVDIFADMNFDIWVLQSIQARLRNNCRQWRSGPEDEYCHTVVDPPFAFLNHSCEPNAEIVSDNVDGSSAIELRALKSIGAGDEICISYLPVEQLALSYGKRQELLKSWTGGKCMCGKCHRERIQRKSHKHERVRKQYWS